MSRAEVPYKITLGQRSPWLIGYHPEKDEMFLYYVDQDDVTWVFWRGGLDSAGFAEFMNLDKAVIMGEL